MGRTHNADWRWAAYHEAGHAVVTIVRAGLVPEICVNENSRGYSRPPREHALVRRCIEISLAGLCAWTNSAAARFSQLTWEARLRRRTGVSKGGSRFLQYFRKSAPVLDC